MGSICGFTDWQTKSTLALQPLLTLSLRKDCLWSTIIYDIDFGLCCVVSTLLSSDYSSINDLFFPELYIWVQSLVAKDIRDTTTQTTRICVQYIVWYCVSESSVSAKRTSPVMTRRIFNEFHTFCHYLAEHRKRRIDFQ